LLCIALVSVVETAIADLARIILGQLDSAADEDAIQKKARKLLEGGPSKYLPKLAETLNMPFLNHEAWGEFRELVATRNVLVHRSDSTADAGYVRQAGSNARVVEGGALDVDNAYLTQMYILMKIVMVDLLQEVLGRPRIHYK